MTRSEEGDDGYDVLGISKDEGEDRRDGLHGGGIRTVG